MIHIEICMSKHKKGAWDMRIGDIDGATEVFNIAREDLLDLISQELDTHMEAAIDK